MQDRILAFEIQAPAAAWHSRRVRVLVTCAALAVALHLALLDSIVGAARGVPEPTMTSVSVRTIEVETATATEAPVVAPPAPEAMPIPSANARPQRPSPQPKGVARTLPAEREASAGSFDSRGSVSTSQEAPPVAPEPAASAAFAATDSDLSASGSPQAGLPAATAAVANAATGGAVAFPGAGDEPPPVYRTRLPPPATLRYHVRRGFLRGDGEIRWQPSSDAYRLSLDARIAGVSVLLQTSEGVVDRNGLAPVRFLDQRARRSPQAANFVRDGGRITFSGAAVEWPLVAGGQDRLSWMIQLAAIAAAQPELLTDGGRITMAVVGARGDASVWSLRYVGVEAVETANGSVRAVQLVREARFAYDTGAEIWLDPERWYLPVRATLRNNAGVSEYDLLLERVDP